MCRYDYVAVLHSDRGHRFGLLFVILIYTILSILSTYFRTHTLDACTWKMGYLDESQGRCVCDRSKHTYRMWELLHSAWQSQSPNSNASLMSWCHTWCAHLKNGIFGWVTRKVLPQQAIVYLSYMRIGVGVLDKVNRQIAMHLLYLGTTLDGCTWKMGYLDEWRGKYCHNRP